MSSDVEKNDGSETPVEMKLLDSGGTAQLVEGGEDDWKKRLDGLHKKLVSEEDDYSSNPSGWLSTHVKDWTFDTDDDYIKCVCEILEQADCTSRNEVCPPILIAAALVTEDKLIELKDPMTSAIELEFNLRKLGKQSDDWHRQHYQELLKVLSEFAVSLLDECVSSKEVKELMKIGDIPDVADMTVLKKIHLAKNKDIVARPLFNSLCTEIVFWHEPGVGLSSPFSWNGLKRFIILIFWNVLYLPAEVIRLLCKDYKGSEYDFHKWLFSPVSCYFADLVNYVVLVLLIFTVVLNSHVGARQKGTRGLISRLKAGEITIDDDSRFVNGSGVLFVELERTSIQLPEWALIACLVSRILCEIYQLLNQKLVFRTASSNACKEEASCCSYWKSDMNRKLKQYWKSDMNKIDIALMVLLLLGFGFKLHYVFYHAEVYGRVCMKMGGCEGDGVDYSLEARRIVYLINCYSVAGLLTLVRLFYCIFLFVPVIGPILRSIQMMLKDVGMVVIILLFFSIGFFIPLYAIVHCYFAVHADYEEKDDEDVFKTMKSPGIAVFTMLLSMLEGKLTYADDVYISKDSSTSIFLSIILVIYYCLFGLLCLNLLIGLITKRYDNMTDNKNRDWRFAQFDCMMSYNVTAPKYGMPFYFPFCIVYITWCFVRMIVEKCLPCCKCKKKDSSKKLDNLPNGRTFAKKLLARRDNRSKGRDNRSKIVVQSDRGQLCEVKRQPARYSRKLCYI